MSDGLFSNGHQPPWTGSAEFRVHGAEFCAHGWEFCTDGGWFSATRAGRIALSFFLLTRSPEKLADTSIPAPGGAG